MNNAKKNCRLLLKHNRQVTNYGKKLSDGRRTDTSYLIIQR